MKSNANPEVENMHSKKERTEKRTGKKKNTLFLIKIIIKTAQLSGKLSVGVSTVGSVLAFYIKPALHWNAKDVSSDICSTSNKVH